MHLRKHHGLLRAMHRPPVANPPLKGPPLRIGELSGRTLLKPGEERKRSQPRFGLQAGLDLRPDLHERVEVRSPGPRRLGRRRQTALIPILARRLLIHASLPRRPRQACVLCQPPPQVPYLSIRDHRNLHEEKELRLSTNYGNPGILIVAAATNASRTPTHSTHSPPLPHCHPVPRNNPHTSLDRPGKVIVAEREK